MQDMNPKVHIQQVSKRFGAQTVLNQIDLAMQDGEFLTLLGPSGCGKTTLLRALAGFYTPDEGRIWVDGVDITQQPPHRRDIGMVFQSYAVFPHMTVAQNVAYGLEARKLPAADIAQRVQKALERVQLAQLGERYASQLSGGQKQRVGLARAMVIEPTLLLMDEPLSNLDAKLRLEMRQEIRLMQRELGITTLYVTHDQEEALAVSDRIAVMHEGRMLQLAGPQEIYQQPAHAFVMDFVGGCIWVEGRLAADAGAGICFEGGGVQGVRQRQPGRPVHRPQLHPRHHGPVPRHDRRAFRASRVGAGELHGVRRLPASAGTAAQAGRALRMALRHEHLQRSNDPGLPGWDGVRVELKTFLGTRFRYRCVLPGGQRLEFDLELQAPQPDEGELLSLRFKPGLARFFDAQTGWALR